jgi:hypothetical protein
MSELGRLIDNYIEEAEKTSKENNATEKVKKTGIRSRVLLGIAGAALLCILCVKLYVILPNTLPWISKAFVSFVPIFIWTAFILIGIVRLKKVTKVRLDESVDKT